MVKLSIIPLEERIVLDAAIAATVAAPPKVIYVNANSHAGPHADGSSWAKAYTNLQDALDAAASYTGSAPEQIWVAKGTYLPTKIYSPDGIAGGYDAAQLGIVNPTDSHLMTFNLPSVAGGISIFGGFKSGMTSLSQRDPVANRTILSGDLLGNDNANPSSRADNVWHVVTAGNDIAGTGVKATLDGLTIMGGNASGPVGSAFFTPIIGNNYNAGGGMYINFDSSIRLNNTVFTKNYAGDPSLPTAFAGDGGGLFSNNSNLTVTHSQFIDNHAITRAGALEAWSTFDTKTHVITVSDSLFLNNSAKVFGGAIVSEGTIPSAGSVFNITDSIFKGNSAAEGGAIVIDSLNTNIDHSTFIGNSSTVAAGALATTNVVNSFAGGATDYTTTITDSLFVNNTTAGDLNAWNALNSEFAAFGVQFSRGGGALVTYINGHLVVKNDTFIGNVAKNADGGAILNGDAVAGGGTLAGVTTTILNSTFVDNVALNGNGGAVASKSLVGLQDPSSSLSHTLFMKGNTLVHNRASGDGGGIYLDGSNATIKSNLMVINQAGGQGDSVSGVHSTVNGANSSSLHAEDLLYQANLILGRLSDAVVLS